MSTRQRDVCMCVCVEAAAAEKVCERPDVRECVRARPVSAAHVFPCLCEHLDTHHCVPWHALNLHYV